MSRETEPAAFFTPATRATFAAAAACIVPPLDGDPGADDPAFLEVADRALSARPERDRALLGKFLVALEVLPWFLYGRGFSRLTPERRDRVLRLLEHNRLVPRLRQGFFGLKTFVLMSFYGHERTYPEIGYPGPRTDLVGLRVPRGGP